MAGNVLLQLGGAGGQPEAATTATRLSHSESLSAASHELGTAGLGSVALIDFADAGIGDPLYDIVALFVSVFECDMDLLRVAVESYCCSRPGFLCGCGKDRMVDVRADGNVTGSGVCDGGSKGIAHGMGGCVSKRFLAYLLLHPEGFVEKLLDKYPCIRGMGSFERVQQHLFGWLEQACGQE